MEDCGGDKACISKGRVQDGRRKKKDGKEGGERRVFLKGGVVGGRQDDMWDELFGREREGRKEKLS